MYSLGRGYDMLRCRQCCWNILMNNVVVLRTMFYMLLFVFILGLLNLS